jgi:alcohol dehydrogenase class IV
MRFEFATAARILFGRGAVADLPKLAREFGSRALLVTGRNTERARAVRDALDCSVYSVYGEPTLEMVRKGALAARDRSSAIPCPLSLFRRRLERERK